MGILLTVIHILCCLFLIIVVLLQSGKAADLAGAFGGMGSQTAFGPRGAATLLSKATTVAAIVFMLNSIALGIWQSTHTSGGQSVIQRAAPVTPPTPETPAPAEGTPAPAGQPVPASQAPQVEVTPSGQGSADINVNVGGAEKKAPDQQP